MVERLQETLKGTTIVDLDGSLISANSMHIFMKQLPRLLMRHHAFGASIAALWWIGLRSIRMTGHRRMKWHLTKIARKHLTESDWDYLAKRISEHINPHVSSFIKSHRQLGCVTYIATAALEEYTTPLCRLLGFEGCLATIFTEKLKDYSELKEYSKRDAIESLLTNENLRLESFITDHTDDIPTAKLYPGLTIVVNPSQKTADLFHEIGVTRYIN